MHINAVLEVDVVALEQEDSVTVMLDLAAPEAEEQTSRPPQAVIVVLDRSGSMSGGRLDSSKRSLLSLVERLDERDWFGVVVFDNQAHVVIPAQRIGDLGRETAKHAIASIQPGGSTDLSSGYLRGLQEADRAQAEGGTTVLVLSDGHANAGITDPVAFKRMAAKAARGQVTSSTIGIGDGYDEQILAELAVGGNGNHTFAREGDAAAAAVAKEIDGLLTKTVQAASMLITPTDDVTTIAVINELPSQSLPGGVMVELGDFYSGEQRRVLVTFEVPAMAALGLAQIASLQLTYVGIPELVTQMVTLPVSVNVVPQDVANGRLPNPEVQKERVLLETQAEKRRTEEALRRGDDDTARGLIAGSIARLESTAPDPDVDAEIRFLQVTLTELDARGGGYTSKRLRADSSKKSRGYRTREQGGQFDDPDGGEESA
jgi:Ca-activated chloride channel family protein